MFEKIHRLFINVFMVFIVLLHLFAVNCECKELNNTSRSNFVSITPGLFFVAKNDEFKIKLDADEIFGGRALINRQDNNNGDGETKQPKILQRVGAFLMLIPLVMQMLSLPGALASIKMSLLKSLIMGKISLIIMLYCLLRHFRSSSEVVVVHKPPLPTSQHFDHYYHAYDDDEGWFG